MDFVIYLSVGEKQGPELIVVDTWSWASTFAEVAVCDMKKVIARLSAHGTLVHTSKFVMQTASVYVNFHKSSQKLLT